MQKINLSRLFKKPFLFLAASAMMFTACEKEDVINVNPNDPAQLFVSSNTSGQTTIFDLSLVKAPEMRALNVANADSDGIHYDEAKDILYQLDRTNNRVQIYKGIKDMKDGDDLKPVMSTTTDFTNGREIAVTPDGRHLVVAQDANDKNEGNRFYVYQMSEEIISLKAVYETSINLWGIHFSGEHLLAIVDNSSDIAAFYNFLENIDGAMVEPTATLTIEGIVRTHGIDYDGASDVMVLTDVGSAEDGTDGAVHIITAFSEKAGAILNVNSPSGLQTSGILTLDKQARIAGSRTLLGNPVDVAYCAMMNRIYVAERKNNGGRVLEFVPPFGGTNNIYPSYKMDVPGASAVFISINDNTPNS